jgi:hypothetical protein
MTEGGDDRITLASAEGVNEYFTSSRPDPQTTARASSTSSNVSHRGFSAAREVFDRLQAAEREGTLTLIFEREMESIRRRIQLYWGSQSLVQSFVIVTPSGSDAEMLPTVAALVRHQNWQPDVPCSTPLVTNIIMAFGEVGSCCATAAALRHFRTVNPLGQGVMIGQCIAGVDESSVDVVGVNVRDRLGVVIPCEEVESEVAALLEIAISRQGRLAVLHAVHSCKTGLSAPRACFLKKMKDLYRDSIVVVVDAAQLRIDASAVGAWIDSGYWVLITGSKFMGGASFSGALLVPQIDAEMLGATNASLFPVGLGQYFCRSNCDAMFGALRQSLPNWFNFGLALRWETALAEGKWLHSLDRLHRDRGIFAWVEGVKHLVRSSKRLYLLDDAIASPVDFESMSMSVGECNSVVCVGVHYIDKDHVNHPMNYAQCRLVHRLMLRDLSSEINSLSPDEAAVAAKRCLVGQPVLISDLPECPSPAILRIAIGAPEMFNCIGLQGQDPAVLAVELLKDDECVVKKLELISNHWSELEICSELEI